MNKFLKKITGIPLLIKIIFVLLILISVVFLVFKPNKKNGYQTVKVMRSNITEVIDETGTVTTSSKTGVYSPVKGIVEELYVANGEIVGVNQKLFKVKSTATTDEKTSAYATLVSAQSSLKTAEQTKNALQVQLEQARKAVIDARISSDNMIGSASNTYNQLEKDAINSNLTSAYWNFNTVEKKYVEADTAIAAARALLANANLTYESTKDRVITSPAIGTVANLAIKEGDSVVATNPVTSNSSEITAPPKKLVLQPQVRV